MTCLRCKHGTANRFGTYTHKGRKSQRFRCKDCSATFSESTLNAVEGHYTDTKQAAQVLNLMLEGMSVRAISRITGMHKNTVLSVMLTAGQSCRGLFNRRIRNLRPRFVQADELWSFVHTKQGHLSPKAPKGWGDAYVWVAMDAETKLILGYLVGKRDHNSCYAFIRDLSKRIRGRFQLSTDGLRYYITAVEEYFGADVDYAQVVKVYRGGANEHPDWYRSSDVIRVVPTQITGNPIRNHISTAYIERANLSVRMHLRRFTRMTNAYSKKRANLTAAVSLYMAWYNFCRVHMTLQVTPAMEAGLTSHIWTIEELLTKGA